MDITGPAAPIGLTDFAGMLFFAARDTGTGSEPWVSAYPQGPTQLLADIDGTPLPSIHAQGFEFELQSVEFGDGLLFAAQDGVDPYDVDNPWEVNGPPTAYLRVTRGQPGVFDDLGTYEIISDLNGGRPPGINIGEWLVFSASTGSGNPSLYRTKLAPGDLESFFQFEDYTFPRHFMRLGNRALFSAWHEPDGAPELAGIHLWITDGTAQGTQPIKPVYFFHDHPWLGTPPIFPFDDEPTFDHVSLGQRVVFRAAASEALDPDYEMWVSDGTAAGTLLLKDILPGDSTSNPQLLTRVGNRVYFTADDGINGRSWWRTDGTPSGTELVPGIPAGQYGFASTVAEVDGRLFFGADGAILSYEEGVGLTVLKQNVFSAEFTAVGSRRVMFSGLSQFSPNQGRELWVSDGTPAGTKLYVNLEPGGDWGNPEDICLSNGHVFLRSEVLTAPPPLVAIPAGATADPIGVPCAASGFLPELRASDPLLGQAVDLKIRDAQPSLAALIFLGPVSRPIVLGSGCTAYMDISQLELLAVGGLDGTGSGALGLAPLPTDPVLVGQQATIQAAIGPSATAPLGFDLSNGVLMTLGQ